MLRVDLMPASAAGGGFLDPAQQEHGGSGEDERHAQQQKGIVVGHGQRLGHDPAVQRSQRGGLGIGQTHAVLNQILGRAG